MLTVLGCIENQHDLSLLALSAVICLIGCFTTTTLMAKAFVFRTNARKWLVVAALVFGSSVWSLHFVAMLAFLPAKGMAYDSGLTAWSAVVASGGALAGLLAWQSALRTLARVVLAGGLFSVGVIGMHYLGVEALDVSSLLSFKPSLVAASVVLCIALFIVALARAGNLARGGRRLEVSFWLALAICSLHFTGMAALTLMPIGVDQMKPGVLGGPAVAMAVGGVSVTILLASLAATLVEQHIARRGLQDLRRMRLMGNLAHEVLLIHRHGRVLEVNNAGERMFKAPANEIIGRPISSLFADESIPALMRLQREETTERRHAELEFQAIDGTRIPVELSCQRIDYLGKPATAVALRDLTDRKRDEARIRHLARHDALTDLPNRYTLLERLEVALNLAARQASGLAVVYIDLDRFKPVNDQHGHAVGDALLIQASKRILAGLRPTDTLARIGGDEFVMVLLTEPKPDAASGIATRTIGALREPFHIEGHRIEIGASIGLALYPNDGATADALMRAADVAMYRAKEEGRGTLRFYESCMNAHLQARLQTKQELAEAIERDELVLHYQPIVSGTTGELRAFEALIRWNHPTRGLLPPTEFIALAEEGGLIGAIERWVFDTAFREAAGWPQPWRISINVSPKQFRHSDICGAIGASLATHGLDPRRVMVELTENILVDNAGQAVATLNRLRDLGVNLALDDFGTGYSSLSYLQIFRFDRFKIGKSFVRKLGQSEDALSLTRAIINLGHNLGLQVTAVGVETPPQLDILRNLACDQVQGYVIGRPASVEEHITRGRGRIAQLFKEENLRISA